MESYLDGILFIPSGNYEVYVGAYKIFTIFTDTLEKYEQILHQEGFAQMENMKTVWSTGLVTASENKTLSEVLEDEESSKK